MKFPPCNCQYCNKSFKYHSSRQRHEQLDCRKRPAAKLPILESPWVHRFST